MEWAAGGRRAGAGDAGAVKENPGAAAPLGVRLLAALAALSAAAAALVLLQHTRLPPPRDPAGAPPDAFLAHNARRHLLALTAIGPRVAGSYENEVLAVRAVVAAVRAIEREAAPHHRVDVDVHAASGAFALSFLDGMTNVYRDVQSVVARVSARGGRRRGRSALLFNCHFDSVPDSPGASDDAAGCAVLLETMRALAAAPRLLAHDAVFLFNGAEENIMQASHAFVTTHRWAKDIRAFINIEACGAGGREVLFQAGPDDPWLVETYAASVPHPFASSLAQEIFESGLVPADTDFRIFRDFGKLSGMDLAWSANGYVYHTRLDTADEVSAATLQRTGDNVLALALAVLLRPELAAPNATGAGGDERPVFFDVVGVVVVRAGRRAALAAAALTLLLALLRLRLGARDTRPSRAGGYARALAAAAWRAMAAGAAGVAAAAAAAALATAAGRQMSWFSRPYMLLPLYALPALGVSGLTALRLWERGAPASAVGAGGWARWALCADALLALWAALLAAAAAARLRSGFVALLWTLPPALAHIAAHYTQGGGRGAGAGRRRWWCWSVAGAALGAVQTWYLAVGTLQMFVPIMGRVGAAMPVEVVMAVMTSVLFLCGAHWMLPLLLVTRRPHGALRALVAAGAAAWALVLLTRLSFPYSARAPQRYMLFHTRRTAHAPLPASLDAAAYWLPDLDAHSPRAALAAVPELRGAVPMAAADCERLPYCGAPYYLPVLSFISRAHWLPAAEPPPRTVRADLSAEALSPTLTRIHFNITGPAHTVVALEVRGAARALSLLAGGAPQEGPRRGARRSYLLTLHDARARSRPAHWRFHADVEHAAGAGGAAAAVAGHSMAAGGAGGAGGAARALAARFPAWAAVSAWSADLHLYSLAPPAAPAAPAPPAAA